MAPFTLRLLLSLVAGLAGGVFAAPATSSFAQMAFAAGVMVGALAHANAWVATRAIATWTAVAGMAWLLGLQSIDRALHPPLRTLLEQRIGGFAIDSPYIGHAYAGDSYVAHPFRGADTPSPRDEPVVVEGTLRQDASLGATGVVMRLAIDRIWLSPHPEIAPGGVSVVVAGGMAAAGLGAWTEGRRVRAPVVLRRPARYLNDGVPDMERALARRGVALVGTIKSSALVELVATGAPWQEWGARMRARVRAVLAAHLSAGKSGAAAVATAILIGDRAALDSEVERRLQEAGTYHVLAISGGNIAILAGAVLGVLALAGWRGRGAALLAIVALGAYAVVVEGGSSVVRATSMALLYLAIRLIDQRTAPVNALALVVIGILLADPLAITDVGLWLTCGATLGILLSAGRAAAASWSVLSVCIALVAATIAAEVMLMPVSALVFERVTLAGLALNFVAIPCMTVVQLAAMALVGFDALGFAGATQLAARVTEWGVWGLLQSAALVDYAPWLTWRVPASPIGVAAAYYGALSAWWVASRPTSDTLARRRVSRVCGPVAAVLFVWIATHPPSLVRALGDGRLHVTTIDVGQGDAILVTFPNGHHLLVDTGGVTIGGDFDVGDRVVGPALRARGVRRLDRLAITHGDPDHIGGARAVIRDFEPREVWQGVPVAGHAPMALLQQAALDVRSTWRTLQRGDRVDVGDVAMHVLHPPPPEWERQRVRNDDSLVFELRFGEVSVVLTGDIGREVEQALLPALAPLPLVALKVPHHGSATSSSAPFIEALSPAVATIGVGRSNPYGHPVPPVLDRYDQAGTETFRTDQDGQIDIVTDGHSIEVRTFTGRVWNTKDTKDTKDTKESKGVKDRTRTETRVTPTR
jgi:competence protein ComEC